MLIEIYCDKFRINGKDGNKRSAIKFHSGLNAIIGDNNRSNSIGKSTFLMIIDFVFGGSDYIKKCSAVHQNIGEHNICFTLQFDGIEYSFIRNNIRFNEIIKCNRQYEPLENEEPFNIDDYRLFLAEKYHLNGFDDLKWRGIMSKHIRIYNRDTMDASRPLQASKDGKVFDDIKSYLKLFKKYSVVEDQIKQAKLAEEEKEAFRKTVGFNHIKMAKTEKDFKENIKMISELEIKEKDLIENSENGLLDLTSMQIQQLNELNQLLLTYSRERAKVQSKLNNLRKEMIEGKKSFTKTYSDLEKYFPGIELKEIEKVESFHQGLSKILFSEFKENERHLATTYVMLSNEISKIKTQIEEIKVIPNVKQAVLKEYSRITTELSNLRAANTNFTTLNDLKRVAKECAEIRDKVITDQLLDIQNVVNDKMREITQRIVQESHLIAPRLLLEKINAYSFVTSGDDGSGSSLRGLITFDLANMFILGLPFLVHDADLMDPISKPILTQIIKEYQSVEMYNKQVFVAFRSFEFYADEVKDILEDCKVLQLETDGNELFGWAWNKEIR